MSERPRPPRLLAITPPTGAVDPELAARWLDLLGERSEDLAVLLRDPGGDLVATLDPLGRLAPLRRACERLGIPTILSSPTLVESLPEGVVGLQLRQDPPPLLGARARRRLGPQALIGRSVHGFTTPVPDVDYAVLAPIFEPTTPQPGVVKVAIGLGPLRASAQGGLRVLALGGIGAENVRECLEAGAWGVAGIGAFFGEANRVEQDVAAFAAALRDFPSDVSTTQGG